MTDLVENGFLGADETPLESPFGAISQFDGVANVEELALVVDISVVAVDFVVAWKRIDNVVADGGGVAR